RCPKPKRHADVTAWVKKDAWTEELELDSSSDEVRTLVEEDDATPDQSGYRPRIPREAANAAMDRYASGDDSAFSELYDLIAPKLHSYLRRQTHDPVRPEDLLQQPMLQLHATRGRFMRGGEVYAWAFAIARRLLIDSYRRRKREARGNQVQSGETVAPLAA